MSRPMLPVGRWPAALLGMMGFWILYTTPAAQGIVFSEAPRNLQLYPRDAGDSAEVVFAGTITTAGSDSVRLEIYRDGRFLAAARSGLIYQGSTAPFRLVLPIRAGLSEHAARFYLDDSLITVRDSLVCGDVFLINGQSNAVSGDAEGLATGRSEWFRSFGTSSSGPDDCRADTAWSLAQGHLWNTHAAVGVWGLTVGLTLTSAYGVPVAILNGAVDGTQIQSHLRNDASPTDLNTIYGRLLWRCLKAGVRTHVRAMLWHQGESDSYSDPWPQYDERFSRLFQAWHQDYGQLEKVYVFQLHPGCGGGFQSEMREYQRTLPLRLPDLEVMATVGLDGYYGCHYDHGGYDQMGRWLLGILTRDLYGSEDTWNIIPPNVQAAWFNSGRDEVRILFDHGVEWPADTLNARLKDFFYITGHGQYGHVASGRVLEDGRTVSLLLVYPVSQADLVSYLPQCCYPNGNAYDGPWLRNPRGIGAFSFCNFPIEDLSEVGASQPGVNPRLLECAPNPSRGEVTIRLHRERTGRFQLEIFDTRGRLLRTLESQSSTAMNPILRWDGRDRAGSRVPGGVYWCRLHGEGGGTARVTVVR